MNDVAVFLLVLGSCVLASLLHELTHYVVARLLGRDAMFVLSEWAVYHETTGDVGLNDWLVQGAPLLVGVASVGLLVSSWPSSIWAVPAWYLYTLHGAVTNDFAFHEVDSTDVEGVA